MKYLNSLTMFVMFQTTPVPACDCASLVWCLCPLLEQLELEPLRGSERHGLLISFL